MVPLIYSPATLVEVQPGDLFGRLFRRRRSEPPVPDAIANAKVIALHLELRKDRNGIYGKPGRYRWKVDGSDHSGPRLLPEFQPLGVTALEYRLVIRDHGRGYLLDIRRMSPGIERVYTTDETGKRLFH